MVLPVAVTRHGQTVGFFVPTARPAQADLQALREAADKLEAVVPLTDDQLESSGRAGPPGGGVAWPVASLVACKAN